jgi:hypothetical protein
MPPWIAIVCSQDGVADRAFDAGELDPTFGR